MIESKQISTIVQGLLDALPSGVASLPQDLEKNLRQTLHNALAKLDLVTREEFDVQTKVLARTREKLEELSEKLQQLEDAAK